MTIYCSKKICTHNSACCSYYNEKKEFSTCKLEDIMIDDQVDDLDLLLYFAIALVTLLFAEWWLKTREQS